jgi:SAM-dependent methyltransferase
MLRTVDDDAVERRGAREAGRPGVPLPRGLVDPRQEARTVFDSVAELYDLARPGYPQEAWADLAERSDIGPDARVLEIGCGTGQATRDLARTGCTIHSLEPGPALAALARRNLAGAANVRVTTVAFEAAELEPETYDLILSATAFHWIDPGVSFARAARLLRVGGSLALLTNLHGSAGTHTQTPFADAIRDLHRRLAPERSWTFPSRDEIRRRAEAGGDVAAVWSRVERKLAEPPSVSHLFDPPVVSTYPWIATYDRPRFLAMLASQSAYAQMDAGRREQFLGGIGSLVDQHLGGTVTKEYVTVLATARRRGPPA